jgi:DNA-binding NarL/FixJ family response regulator
MSAIRVVLIEDHDLMRAGMSLSLQQQGCLVVGEAATGLEGLSLTEKLHPDVVIVDLGLPDIDGIEVTRQIKHQADNISKVLVLTFRDQPQEVLAAFAAGADSYCMKDVSPDRLLEAMQTTHTGHHWIDPAIAGIVLQQLLAPEFLPRPATETVNIQANAPEYEQILAKTPLSDRELEVLQLIVEGDSNAVIAEKLFITIGTVKTHVRNILNKLCADDRTQAAVKALRSGLIH